MRLLIVADQAPLRHALVDFLQSHYPGISILTAETVARGMSKCAGFAPDLVLTDLALPDGSGIAFTAEIVKRHPGTPVIMVSAHTASIYIERAKAAGAHAYVAKHRLHRDLIGAIESALPGISTTGSAGRESSGAL